MKRASSLLSLSLIGLASVVCTLQAQNVVQDPIFDVADERFHDLIAPDAQLEILAEGFGWSEGPVWISEGDYLLFNDIPNNTMYRWDETDGLSIFMRPAGYSGSTPQGREMGANGLMLHPDGHLLMCDHGNRAVSVLNLSNFTRRPLATHYQGRRLNSPNDLVLHSNGDLYFSDPPYGLHGLNRSPHKELPFNGVYRLSAGGHLDLLTDALTFPNGVALSPDEQTLYVAVSDGNDPHWMAYDVQADGTVSNARVFFDAKAWQQAGRQGLPDGMVIDENGNLFATGPGGVVVFTPNGEHLGTILTGQPTANCTFGDDGSTLYITANNYLMRIRTQTRGLGF